MRTKPKPRRLPAADFTAMADIAFLLLSFFILTFQTKSADLFPKDIPVSQTATRDISTPLFEIGIDQTGRVSVHLDRFDIKQELLEMLEIAHGRPFPNPARAAFLNTIEFGLGLDEVPLWLSEKSTDGLINYKMTGIDADKNGDNQLSMWIKWTRKAAKRVNAPIYFALKGDQNTSYIFTDRVIHSLQAEGVNRFLLLTNLETGPKRSRI